MLMAGDRFFMNRKTARVLQRIERILRLSRQTEQIGGVRYVQYGEGNLKGKLISCPGLRLIGYAANFLLAKADSSRFIGA
jgi:hypothetical protein